MLGPLEVWSGEDWVSISAAKWRSLLACLLLKPGQIVSTESLIFELWGDTPPPTATNLVSIYVHRLRRAIGDAEGRVLVHRKPGYQLIVADDDTDLRQFESLAADGRAALAAGDPETAAAVLREAESLWRGGFLVDVSVSALVSTESERSAELRLAAAELRIGADLTCGRYAEVIPQLRSLVAEHPLREGLWLLLMRALDGAGRHAEALDTYGHAREMIADELGVDPGAELQRLYAELLAADAPPASVPVRPVARQKPPAAGSVPRSQVREASGTDDEAGGIMTGPGPAQSPGSGSGTAPGDVPGTIAVGAFADLPGPDVPAMSARPPEAAGASLPQVAQLPADIGDFTGRELQVRHLADMLTLQDVARGPGAVRIAVVAGAAGLGKTTLAVHAAHQVRSLFPDGQLYGDLSGASADPAAPGEVLARFLRDLGVDGDKVPAGDDERAALYRTRLTGRRVLILLDNAKDAAQVRPLLPGSALCAVLVTTRNRTPDLVGTRFVDLNVLSDTEALELFSRIVGDDRPAAEPDATAEILLACAGLPLAIRICAARLAARGHWRVATMANRLRDEQRRLDELQIGDLEVRASFQVSYDSLNAGRGRVDLTRVFRLLGLWQGRTISLAAATALVGEREGDVADALEALVDVNLLESHAPDWYRFHDLLRFYATERAQAEDAESTRDAAVARLLRWYLGIAQAAADFVSPRRYRVPCDTPPQVSYPVPEDVFGWYDDERLNVIFATRQAAAAGLHDIAWRLATALFPIFNRRDNWTDCITVHRIAVSSARKAGNRRGEAWTLQNLGAALIKLKDAEAIGHLEEALAIRRELADRDGEATTAISLADAYYKVQGAENAIDPSLRSLEVLRETGNDYLLAGGLNNHADLCLELGRLDEAEQCLREALAIPKEVIGYVYGYAVHNLGRVCLQSGRMGEALASFGEAHRVHTASGDLRGQATALKFLGQAQRESGEEDMGRASLAAALVIFEVLKEDNEIAKIQSALAALSGFFASRIAAPNLRLHI
ncbi:MAG TPA: BTAD domain-containing putative transcriptional regulator [Trebonia sp.]|nr:BTAD domain-containing putative transcriptional regulator [Trebonia sp.]